MAEKVVQLINGIKACLEAYQREGADFFDTVKGFKTARFNGYELPNSVPFAGVSMVSDQFIYDTNSMYHDYTIEVWIVEQYPAIADVTESDSEIYIYNNVNAVASWLRSELKGYLASAGNPIVFVRNVYYAGEGRIGAQPSLTTDYSFAVIEVQINNANHE